MTATTATTMLAEPTCALTGASLEAAADYEEARGERACAVEAFRAAVHPKKWELYQTLEEPEGKARDAELDLHIAEFCRHFPGLAPAIRLTWAHVIDTRLDNVGACCTDGGPVDP